MSEQFQYHMTETVETGSKFIPLTHINCTRDRSLSWFDTGISIKTNRVVELIIWAQSSPLSEMMQLCKGFARVYSVTWKSLSSYIDPSNLCTYSLVLSVLRRSNKYQFSSLWFDETGTRTHDLPHSKQERKLLH